METNYSQQLLETLRGVSFHQAARLTDTVGPVAWENRTIMRDIITAHWELEHCEPVLVTYDDKNIPIVAYLHTIPAKRYNWRRHLSVRETINEQMLDLIVYGFDYDEISELYHDYFSFYLRGYHDELNQILRDGPYYPETLKRIEKETGQRP